MDNRINAENPRVERHPDRPVERGPRLLTRVNRPLPAGDLSRIRYDSGPDRGASLGVAGAEVFRRPGSWATGASLRVTRHDAQPQPPSSCCDGLTGTTTTEEIPLLLPSAHGSPG